MKTDCTAHRDRRPPPSPLWSLHYEKEPQRSADDARAFRSSEDQSAAFLRLRMALLSPLSHDKEQPMVGSSDDGSAAFHETLI